MRRFFFDCEFIEDGKTIDLISIGIVSEDGREYYAVNREAPWRRIAKHQWLVEHVARYLPRIHGDRRLQVSERTNPLALDFDHPDMKTRARIATEVLDFLVPVGSEFEAGETVELWADYSAYDHVVLCQLYGTMMDLPPGLPMRTRDLEDLWEWAGRPEKPVQADGAHNALADARWDRELWRTCWVVTA